MGSGYPPTYGKSEPALLHFRPRRRPRRCAAERRCAEPRSAKLALRGTRAPRNHSRGTTPGVLLSRSHAGCLTLPESYRESYSPGVVPGVLLSRCRTGCLTLPESCRVSYSPGVMPGVLLSRCRTGSLTLPVSYRESYSPGVKCHVWSGSEHEELNAPIHSFLSRRSICQHAPR